MGVKNGPREGSVSEKRGSKKGRNSTLRADVISANVVSLFLCLNTDSRKESLRLPMLFPVRLGYGFFCLACFNIHFTTGRKES